MVHLHPLVHFLIILYPLCFASVLAHLLNTKTRMEVDGVMYSSIEVVYAVFML